MQNEQKNKLEKCAALRCFPPFEVLLALRAHLKKNRLPEEHRGTESSVCVWGSAL